MLSLLLCVHRNGSSYIFSPQQEQIITDRLYRCVYLLYYEQSLRCSLTSGYSCPESFLIKQIPLEPFQSGEGHGLTPVPRDATKGEVYGQVNYQLQRQLKPEGLSTSPCYAVGNW